MNNEVVILDAGSQYSKLIQRQIQELGVQSVILTLESNSQNLDQYAGIIISGGPMNIEKEVKKIYLPKKSVPILGICYGMQYLAFINGGKLGYKQREDGQYKIQLNTEGRESILFEGLDEEEVLLTHGVSVISCPKFKVIAERDGVVLAMEKDNVYGVQFHPEVELTTNGKTIFDNFLFKICQIKVQPKKQLKYPLPNKVLSQIDIQKYDKPIVCLVSGGVDSSVCATLLKIHNNVRTIHIDNGFMRHLESETVCQTLGAELIDAKNEFYEALKDVTEPEQKRKIIGDTFIKIARQYIGKESLLCQGTLRPDLIESGSEIASQKADTIKTHHNDSPLARELRKEGRVIEPLKELHKDEVRQLGKELGLPEVLYNRMPFPGPGLAIRILCEKESWLKPCSNTVFQLPVKSVGVQGDQRSYMPVVATTEFLGWEKLLDFAKERGGRVVYLHGGPVKTVGLTRTMLEQEEISLIREADRICNEILSNYEHNISQMPIILLPCTFGKIGNRSIVIRTIVTKNFMTGRVAVPGKDFPQKCLWKMIEQLGKLKGISRVMYDLTGKPPGTTEWE